MDSFVPVNQFSDSSSLYPYSVLFNGFSLIPISHYLLAFVILLFVFLYNFFEFHFCQDFFSGFRGTAVELTYNPLSPIYNGVVSHCKILHGRYLATPWLSSPHFQTCFLSICGRPPVFSYRRQIYHTSDGGTIALDWLLHSDETETSRFSFLGFHSMKLSFIAVSGDRFLINNAISKDDTTPIVIVIPGLTSDSAAAYIKHFVFNTAKHGRNAVVINHRGLGGVSITSDCFYNAGWTEDIRVVINYLHHEFPKAPLLAVGTSVGANVLVKYLGEDGEKTHISGAAAICNPWDLVIGDRYLCRRLLQRFYCRVLATGLQKYAKLHESRLTRLANWEGIIKSRYIREFDNHATCLVGKFETPDTYYRHCSSSHYIGNVSVPLLCINALDDPVCSTEAIPWDECRANKNIVLATLQHGGHIAFFEGLTATRLWWVRAVDEYLGVLHSSPYMHVQKEQTSSLRTSEETSIDQGPYLNVAEDGMVAAMGGQEDCHIEARSDFASENTQTSGQHKNMEDLKVSDITTTVRRRMNQISRKNGRSIWLLAFIAFVTSWPVLGSALIIYRKKLKKLLPASLLGR